MRRNRVVFAMAAAGIAAVALTGCSSSEEPPAPAPVESTPVDPMPADTVPADTAEGDPMEGETPPDTMVEGDPMGGDTAAGEDAVAGATIADLAATTDGLGTLAAAVSAANLTEALSVEGPYTVFAPSDEAFAALPPGVLDALLLPENKDVLVQVLAYHVVPGEILAADVTDGEAVTMAGEPVALTTEGGVAVNGAKVIQADVMAENGVVHVVDTVILPPNVDVDALLAK